MKTNNHQKTASTNSGTYYFLECNYQLKFVDNYFNVYVVFNLKNVSCTKYVT